MKTKTLLTSLAGLALSLSCSHAATTIFSDDFNGSTSNLDGASPDVGAGTWTAAAPFDRNGDVNITNANAGSATLAFTPSNGLIYTLESSVTLSTGGSGDWIGFGFANGQSSTSGTGRRFLDGNTPEGRAWIYARENTNNPRTLLTGSDATPWDGFTNSPTDLDLRIVLDTTGGTGNWTATWFAKDAGDTSFTEIGGEKALTDEDINSVGFSVAGNGVTADITNFSLTSVPEPSATLLGALGALALLIRRRR